MKILQVLLISISLHFSLSAASNMKIVQDLLGSDFKVHKVEKSHGDMHIAYVDSGELLYVDIKNKLIFYGVVLTKKDDTLVNLTREDKSRYQDELSKQTMKTIDMKEIKKVAVLDKLNGGNSKNAIVMFDSLTCPYCLKVNKFLKTNGYKVDVYRIFNQTGSIKTMLQDKYSVNDADKKIDEMDSIYRKYKILSTPNIFVINDDKIVKIIRGANIKEIKKWVQK